MKKLMLFVTLLSLTSLGLAESHREASSDRLDNAGKVISEIMSAPDRGIPEEVLDHAKCIAVVPHMLKGGFVFGAENGRGVATCRTADGWSAPAFFAITGGSWGLQIGIEGIDLVMIIQGMRPDPSPVSRGAGGPDLQSSDGTPRHAVKLEPIGELYMSVTAKWTMSCSRAETR